MEKTYKSFKQLDDDIKILKLEKDIAVWALKNNIQKSFSFSNLTQSALNIVMPSLSKSPTKYFIQKEIIGFILNKIFKKRKKKK